MVIILLVILTLFHEQTNAHHFLCMHTPSVIRNLNLLLDYTYMKPKPIV